MINYNILEERIINSYLEQSATKFIYNNKSELSEKDQKILYDFTKKIYLIMQKNPEILFNEFHDDDAHPNRFNCSSYNKPYLKKFMRKAIKTIDDFMYIIYSIGLGKNENIKISKKYTSLLNAVGINYENGVLVFKDNPMIFNILQQLIGNENLPFQNFIKCMYDEQHEYFIDLFKKYSIDHNAYNRLMKWLEENDYSYITSIVSNEIGNSESCGFGFFKKVNNDDGKHPSNMYGHSYIGLFIDYNVLIQEPVVFSLRVQNIRNVLKRFDELEDILKDFICNYHARCSGCNYCIQRHLKKNNSIKTFAIFAEYKDKKLALCPINYVYSYNWNELNSKLAEGIIAYLEIMEKENNLK
jgi:hypothetical protein